MELLAAGQRIGYLLKGRVTDATDFVDTLERIARRLGGRPGARAGARRRAPQGRSA